MPRFPPSRLVRRLPALHRHVLARRRVRAGIAQPLTELPVGVGAEFSGKWTLTMRPAIPRRRRALKQLTSAARLVPAPRCRHACAGGCCACSRAAACCRPMTPGTGGTWRWLFGRRLGAHRGRGPRRARAIAAVLRPAAFARGPERLSMSSPSPVRTGAARCSSPRGVDRSEPQRAQHPRPPVSLRPHPALRPPAVHRCDEFPAAAEAFREWLLAEASSTAEPRSRSSVPVASGRDVRTFLDAD